MAAPWEETVIEAYRGDDAFPATVRFAAGDPCVVEVLVGREDRVRTEGPDLFEALVDARRMLERRALRLACNGSRRDVYPSQMQRQATQGRRAYVMTMPRTTTRLAVVDIFAVAPAGVDIAT